MKHLIITTLVFTSLLITSCNSQIKNIPSISNKGNGNITTETRNIDNFTGLKVSGSYHVYVNNSPNNGKLTIEADENLLDKIETYVEDGTLKIQTKKNTSVNYSKSPVIHVSAQNIKNVAHSGSGRVELDGTQNVNQFNLAKSGSGTVIAKVNAPSSNLSKSGSGKIEISGTTESLNISKSGSGKLNADDLEANNVNIKASGSGNINIWANNKLNIAKSGSGNVYYKGKPSVVLTNSGSGKVINKN